MSMKEEADFLKAVHMNEDVDENEWEPLVFDFVCTQIAKKPRLTPS